MQKNQKFVDVLQVEFAVTPIEKGNPVFTFLKLSQHNSVRKEDLPRNFCSTIRGGKVDTRSLSSSGLAISLMLKPLCFFSCWTASHQVPFELFHTMCFILSRKILEGRNESIYRPNFTMLMESGARDMCVWRPPDRYLERIVFDVSLL